MYEENGADMFSRVLTLFQGTNVAEAPAQAPDTARPARAAFAGRVLELNRDPYLCVADEALKLISVFDDLKYDRADIDILSGPMRERVRLKLAPLGFRQVSVTFPPISGPLRTGIFHL
ncbi:MAG: hypothetical protein AAGE76_12540 [Pseudomonadota bacterium]